MEASTSAQPQQPATPSHHGLLPSLSPSVKNEPTPAPLHTLPAHLHSAGPGGGPGNHPNSNASPSVAQTPTRMLPPPNPNGTPTPAQRGQKVFTAVMGSAPGQVPPSPASSNARVYASVYSGIPVYEAMIRGISVMRRTSDSWVNATQILKVAGIPKSARTKILDKDIVQGEHEKVQGGYGKYQGTWVPFQRGQDLAEQYGVTAYLSAIFDFEPSPNSLSALPVSRADTPNKSGGSLSAAGYNAGFMNQQQPAHQQDPTRMISPFQAGQMSGTHPPPPPPQWNDAMMHHYHQHPMMAGYPGQPPLPPPNMYYPQQHQPMPTPPPYIGHQQPQQHRQQQMTPSQSIDDSLAPAAELNGIGLPPSKSEVYYDEFGQTHPIHTASQTEQDHDHDMEPPAKRIKAEGAVMNVDEDDEDEDELRDAPPLPTAMRLSSKPIRPKQSIMNKSSRNRLLGLFRDDAEIDVRAHLGIKPDDETSTFEIDAIIDEHGHTALHWAASLAKIQITKDLIELGADIHRGNFNGETPLTRAMLTTNNAEAGTLSDLLGLLAPSIRTLDQSYRSVIHHIALVSGLVGRAAAARMYMTGVLEWVAKEQQMSASLGQGHASGQGNQNGNGNGNGHGNGNGTTPGLGLKTLVDVQDLFGDTALNVSARTGNRGLVKLLLDAGADKSKANKLGLKPVDFGVEVEALAVSAAETIVANIKSETSRPERRSRDIQKNIAAIFENINETFSTELTAKQTTLNQTEQNVRHATRSLADKRQQIHRSQLALNELEQIARKSENIRRALSAVDSQDWTGRTDTRPVSSAFKPLPSHVEQPQSTGVNGIDIGMPAHGSVDSVTTLRRMRDWEQRAAQVLEQRTQALEGEGLEKELKYRRLVSLCTKVPVDKVDSMLEHLTSAIDSDGPSIDLTRITTFINRMKNDVGVGSRQN